MTAAEYEKKYGQKPMTIPVATNAPATLQKSSLPLLTNQQGGFGTALKDVAVGAGKGIIEGTRSTAQAIQGLGKGFMRAVGGSTEGYGVRSLDDTTPEGEGVTETLRAKSRGEQVGKGLGIAGDVASGFVAAKGPQAVAKGMQAYRAGQEAKAAERALEAITPETSDITSKNFKKLLRQGKIEPGTMTQPSRYVLSDEERAIALKNRALIDKSPVRTSINIIKDITRKDAEVGKFLRKNNGIFNTGELRNHILKSMEGIDDVSIPEERIAKLKNILTDGFIRALKKKDMESLWEARKAFDRSIESAFSGSPTLQKSVKKEFRNAIQDFIMERTPDDVYRGKMKDMSDLFRLFDNVSEKATKQKGKSQIEEWMKRNPRISKAIGWGVGAAGAGSAYNILAD